MFRTDVTIRYIVFDESNSSSMGTWKGLIDEANKDMGYLIPGYDDSKYICNLDYSDKGTWYMLVKDVTGNKYIGFMLTLLQIMPVPWISTGHFPRFPPTCQQ